MEFRGYTGNQVVLYVVGILILAAIVAGWYTVRGDATSEIAAVLVIVIGSYVLGWRHGEADKPGSTL